MMPKEATALEKETINCILDTRACILARQREEEEIEGEYLNLLTFPLGDEWFGVETDFIQEVQPLKKQMWSLVPNTPDFIIGAVNIRGRIYSMMHIGRFLGIKEESLSDQIHVLLVRGGDIGGMEEMEICILADGIPEVKKISTDAIQPPSATISAKAQDCIRGVTDEMLTILFLNRLLSDPEIIVHEEA